jgi:hypothetical protein
MHCILRFVIGSEYFHQELPWVAQRSGSHKKFDQRSLKDEEDNQNQCPQLSLLSHRQYVVYCPHAAPKHWYWTTHNFWSDGWCHMILQEFTIWDTAEWSPWTLMLCKWAFMIPYQCQHYLSCWCMREEFFLGFGELSGAILCWHSTFHCKSSPVIFHLQSLLTSGSHHQSPFVLCHWKRS